MPDDSVSLETAKLPHPHSTAQRSMRLQWKIGFTLSTIILVLGLLVLTLVYFLTGGALRRQVDLRSSAIAATLSDAAAPYISRRSVLELDALVAKYGRLEGVAYAFVQNRNGEVIASSAQPFPADLKSTLNADSEARTPISREITVEGKSVYETRVPVLDGQLGAVRVGLWEESVRENVRNTLLPIIGLTAIFLVIGAILSLLIARTTIKPITELAVAAEAISRGELDTPIDISYGGEIGELARSIERMRASLKAAISRLSRT